MSCVTSLPNCSGSSSGESSTRVYNEIPTGAINCVNLTFATFAEFDPDTLIVRLDGIVLDPDQYTIGINNQSFTLIVDADDPKALHSPPSHGEVIRVDYTLQGSGGSSPNDCLTLL